MNHIQKDSTPEAEALWAGPDATLPIDRGAAGWVADLLERVEATDLDSIVDRLTEVLREVEMLARARQLLSQASAEQLRTGMRIAAGRRVSA